jgi:hypothetical protein
MLIVKDKYELWALHRALYEARFRCDPEDQEIAGSGLLADIHKRLMDAIIEAEGERGKKTREWLKRNQPELEVLAGRMRRMTARWNTHSDETKRQYVLCSISPFTVSEEDINRLIEIGDAAADADQAKGPSES